MVHISKQFQQTTTLISGCHRDHFDCVINYDMNEKQSNVTALVRQASQVSTHQISDPRADFSSRFFNISAVVESIQLCFVGLYLHYGAV